MPRVANAMVKVMIVAAKVSVVGSLAGFASLSVTGQTFSQGRDRYDNSLDMRAPLARKPRTEVTNAPRRDLPDNCYTGVATDRSAACAAPSQVTAPPPSVPSLPCTPKTALRN